VKKRRERLDEARFFNRDRLERPGMVRGVEAGPGVSWHGSDPMAESGNGSGEASMLINENEKTVLLFPKPPSMIERNSLTGRRSYHAYSAAPATPPKPYGTSGVNPFASPGTVPGSLYELHNTDLDTGAPPMPGMQGPAPYGSYANSSSTYPSRWQQGFTQMAMGGAPTNPFASPVGSRRGSMASVSNVPRPRVQSNNTSSALAHSLTPSQMHPKPPLLSFGHEAPRPDSSHSTTFSEVHVGHAVKVQVGAAVATAPPKYQDISKQEEAAAKPRPQSLYTDYDPEDAYGGM